MKNSCSEIAKNKAKQTQSKHVPSTSLGQALSAVERANFRTWACNRKKNLLF
jgi:hypothetical protein